MTTAAPASLPSCSVEFRTRYAETDQMGIIHHANYLAWCEIGRTDLIRRLYKSYAEVEKEDGVLLAVTDVGVRYLQSARYDDLVRVTTTLERVRSRAVDFVYLVERVEEDGSTTRLATARTGLTPIDRSGRPRTLPAEIQEAFRRASGEPA
ncbi:MAG TPA: thioesterase family protein [Longimicrobium sp.]|nr:thioesterase family protein [Longimicrobium sp.]